MKCTCPKCEERIELEVPGVTEEGTVTSCPNCKAAMTVYAESFGGRALRRTGEISCASCGNELGPQVYCESCGVPYPRYLVYCLGKKKLPGKGAKVKLKSSPFQKSAPASAGQFPTLEAALSQDGAPRKAAEGKKQQKSVVIGITLLVLLVAGVAGFSFYGKWKVETAYMKNFARAAYGIQVGVDMSRKVCQRIAIDWQTSLDAGKPFMARASADDERELQSIRAKLDSVKAKFAEEPEKFQNCNQRLVKLEGCYSKMQNLAVSPSPSLPAFNEAISKVEAEYKQAAAEFKNGMPPELMEELHEASKIYRDLKPLLQ